MPKHIRISYSVEFSPAFRREFGDDVAEKHTARFLDVFGKKAAIWTPVEAALLATNGSILDRQVVFADDRVVLTAWTWYVELADDVHAPS